ncbi:MAG: hypothetical protein D6812_10415 [Deltaproteobacteria bacterium]|nr:MAG: hypothetical protein D6812_10415 [Deltaproteobacteria bacterium]
MERTKVNSDTRNRGVVLISLIGVLSVVSILGLTFFSMVHFDLTRTEAFETRLQAAYLAQAGVEAAIERLVTDRNDWDALNEVWALDDELFRAPKLYSKKLMIGEKRSSVVGGYDVTRQYDAKGRLIRGIEDEESKIKLVPEMKEVLTRYLGIPEAAVERLIETKDTSTIDEEKVQFLTRYGHGRININTAPVEVLAALPELTPELAQRIVDYRNGTDRISGTEDDQNFPSVEALRWVPGFSDHLWQRLRPYLAVHSDTFTIRALGRIVRAGAHPVRSRITVVIDRRATPVKILFRAER